MSKRRVLFVSNSQGTAAGLVGDLEWCNYPLLVQEQMPDVDCRYWMMSDLSVETIDNLFREVIMPHRADIVILQCGIIETALRILPKNLRDLFRIIPGGPRITRVLHTHRRGWLRLLNRLHIQFVEVALPCFVTHLQNIHEKCLAYGIQLLILTIPLLSDQCEQDTLPGTNAVIRQYNAELEKLAAVRHIPLLDPFDPDVDPSRNSLYLHDSVHFTPEGHRLIASSVTRYLREVLK